MRAFKNTIATLLLLPILLAFTVRVVKDITFNRECGGHLKRAADANTVDLAKQELAVTVNYLEANHLTTGYTSILYTTPDEDIGFWYTNLKSSLDELNSLKPESSHMERSNMLLKLRQTLLDHTQTGEQITCPAGISIYPANTIFMLWYVIGTLLSLVAGVMYLEANT